MLFKVKVVPTAALHRRLAAIVRMVAGEPLAGVGRPGMGRGHRRLRGVDVRSGLLVDSCRTAGACTCLGTASSSRGRRTNVSSHAARGGRLAAPGARTVKTARALAGPSGRCRDAGRGRTSPVRPDALAHVRDVHAARGDALADAHADHRPRHIPKRHSSLCGGTVPSRRTWPALEDQRVRPRDGARPRPADCVGISAGKARGGPPAHGPLWDLG